MLMEPETFERVVVEALDALPEEFRERLANVAVVVEEQPEPARVAALGLPTGQTLLGLYEGVPHHRRTGGYHLAVPDRITLYRQPILAQVGTGDREAIRETVRRTVIHEVAHHFGIGDAELARLEREGSG